VAVTDDEDPLLDCWKRNQLKRRLFLPLFGHHEQGAKPVGPLRAALRLQFVISNGARADHEPPIVGLVRTAFRTSMPVCCAAAAVGDSTALVAGTCDLPTAVQTVTESQVYEPRIGAVRANGNWLRSKPARRRQSPRLGL
jgi:hypothetical protein